MKTAVPFLSQQHMRRMEHRRLQLSRKALKNGFRHFRDGTTNRAAALVKAELVNMLVTNMVQNELESWAKDMYTGTVFTYVDTHAGAGSYKCSKKKSPGTPGTALSVILTLLKINDNTPVRG